MLIMKDRILFLIDNEWLRFCIAKFIQQNYDCESFAVIDIPYTSKKFFQNQQIVKFQKTWFYRDYVIKTDKKPDIEYLKYFEEKYKINIWNIAFAERFFFKFNPFYKFSYDEILSLLEQECRLFEIILDEVKPHFLVIKLTDSHQSNLLHQMCKMKNIRTLMLGPTRFAYRYAVYSDYDQFDDMDEIKNNSVTNLKTIPELQNYLNEHHAVKEITTYEKRSKTSFFNRFVKYIKYLMLIGNPEFKSYYANYGKTRLRVISRVIFIKKWYRKHFIDKYFIKKIDTETPYVYLPLHVEPERSTLLVAPYFTNQIEIITHIAKSLPVGYKLFVKEHIGMFLVGWRETSYYKKILEFPNVCLIHPSVKSEDLLKNSSLVINVAGTTGIEAAFYNKPVIAFADVSYSTLPSVYRIRNIEDLPNAIRMMLGKETDLVALNNYVNMVEKNSFEFDLNNLYLDFDEYFSEDFNNGLGDIPISKMESFLAKYGPKFEPLAMEHIKKIKQWKGLKI